MLMSSAIIPLSDVDHETCDCALVQCKFVILTIAAMLAACLERTWKFHGERLEFLTWLAGDQLDVQLGAAKMLMNKHIGT